MKVISGQRIAQTFLSPTGAEETEHEIDFQLTPNGGILIDAVQGYGHYHDDSPAVSDTVPANSQAHQTLHLETGATEDLLDVAGEDAFNIDTEIFYVQKFTFNAILGATATFGAGVQMTQNPSGLWVPPEPILSPRNITHKATTVTVGTFLECGMLIYYRFVELSDSELGVALARR